MTALLFVLSSIAILQSRTLALIGWKVGVPMAIGWAIGNVIAWYFVP